MTQYISDFTIVMTQYCFFILLHRTICHHIIVFTHHHIMIVMYAHIIASPSYYHNTLLYTHAHTASTYALFQGQNGSETILHLATLVKG